MLLIIFFSIIIFAFNLEKIKFNSSYASHSYFIRNNKTEYSIIYSRSLWNGLDSHILRVDAKTDEIITDNIIFTDELLYFHKLINNAYIYTFKNYLILEKNGRKRKILYDGQFSAQSNSGNTILIGTWNYQNDKFNYDFYNKHYEVQLNLLKEPYNGIYKTLIIANYTDNNYFKLIGLKDYFIFIKIEEKENYLDRIVSNEGNYTYKILDLNLNVINSLTIKYKNYSSIIFSKLTENKEINEFIMCIKYFRSITECQIIKSENSSLLFSKPYQIFSKREIKMGGSVYSNYYLSMNPFDGDKIGCHLLLYRLFGVHWYVNDNFVTIL